MGNQPRWPMIHPEQAVAVKEHRLAVEKAFEIGAFFALLKDPTRLQIIYALHHAPTQELTVSDLAAGLERDDTTISHQMRILRDNRIVALRKVGRIVYYRLIDQHIFFLLDTVFSHLEEEKK